jgi:phage tail-like protein
LKLATLDADTGVRWGADPAPRPLALTLLDDRTLAIFDPLRPMLWHMSRTGVAMPALSWFDPDELPDGWSPISRRFQAQADLTVGPIDGGIYDLAWHEVQVDADLPDGTSLEVQTFASNDRDEKLRAWAPDTPLTVVPKDQKTQRLVLSDQTLWKFWRLGRATRDKPTIAVLDGTGPSSSDRLHIPRSSARQLRVGDTIRLTTQDGGYALATVKNVADAVWTVAATGEAVVFNHPTSLRLIERDGTTLPYGPISLDFLAVPDVPLVVLRRDGRPTEVHLPAALAALAQAGDVLELGDDAIARIELIEPRDKMVEIQLETPVTGDFSTSGVILEQTPGRLVVRDDLPMTGPLPPRATLTLVAPDDTVRVTPVWSDASSRTLWLSATPAQMDSGGAFAEFWSDIQFPEPDATDRGQFIWVRLRMSGRGLPPPGRIGPAVTASASPLLKSLRIVGPRYSLLDWLPPLFAKHDVTQDPPGANFLERFLSLFEGHLTQAEVAFDSISRLLNPRAADNDWLDFVAGWLDLAFDPSWPMDRRRQLVIEGAHIQSGRGTPASLRRYLEIYTGNAVGVSEDYLKRPREPIQLGARGALGIAPLGGATLAQNLAHQFRVTVTLPGHSDRRTEVAAIRGIIDQVKPAHTDYKLETDGSRPPRIGMGTNVGAIIIPGPGRVPPCTCDPDADFGPRPQPGNLASGGFRLGGRLGSSFITDYRQQGG